MKEEDSVKDYTSKLIKVVNQMKLHGDTIIDENVVQKILISLPDKFDPKVATIEESKDLPKLSITELVGSLQAHEQRISSKSEGSVEGSFMVKHKARNSP